MRKEIRPAQDLILTQAPRDVHLEESLEKIFEKREGRSCASMPSLAASSAVSFCLDAMSASLAQLLFNARRLSGWSDEGVTNATGSSLTIIPGTGRHQLWGLIQHPREKGALLLTIDFVPQFGDAGLERMSRYRHAQAAKIKDQDHIERALGREIRLLRQITGQDPDYEAIISDPRSFRPASPGDPIRRIAIFPIDMSSCPTGPGAPHVISQPGRWGKDVVCAQARYVFPAKDAFLPALRNVTLFEHHPSFWAHNADHAEAISQLDNQSAPVVATRMRSHLETLEAMRIVSDFIAHNGLSHDVSRRASRIGARSWMQYGGPGDAELVDFGLALAHTARGLVDAELVDRMQDLALKAAAKDLELRFYDLLALRARVQNLGGCIEIDGADNRLETEDHLETLERLSIHQLGREYRISFIPSRAEAEFTQELRLEINAPGDQARHLATFLLDEGGVYPGPGPSGKMSRVTDADLRHINSLINAIDEADFIVSADPERESFPAC